VLATLPPRYRVPDGVEWAKLYQMLQDDYDTLIEGGQGPLAGKIFRIGHLGFFNDLMLCGTLAGVEMGLALAEVPHRKGGVDAAMAYLAAAPSSKLAHAA